MNYSIFCLHTTLEQLLPSVQCEYKFAISAIIPTTPRVPPHLVGDQTLFLVRISPTPLGLMENTSALDIIIGFGEDFLHFYVLNLSPFIVAYAYWPPI